MTELKNRKTNSEFLYPDKTCFIRIRGMNCKSRFACFACKTERNRTSRNEQNVRARVNPKHGKTHIMEEKSPK